MTSYITINDVEVEPEAPIISSLGFRWRDNAIAIAEGASGAPRVVDGAIDWTTVNNSIGQTQVGNDAIGQGELRSSAGDISITGTYAAAIFTLPGGEYGFYPTLRVSTTVRGAISVWGWTGVTSGGGGGDGVYTSGSAIEAASGNSTSKIARIRLAVGNDSFDTAYANQVYISASPPHNLGYGEIGRFVFAAIDNATGKVMWVYSATEAPWHYNGKTDIRPHKIENGKKYRARKEMSGIPVSLEQARASSAKMLEYAEHFKNAETVYEEITDELKNRDMPDIPHPFTGNDLKGKTVVLLDPACGEMHKMNELCECHDEFSINDLLHEGNIKIDNDALDVTTPPGVKTVKFRMK